MCTVLLPPGVNPIAVNKYEGRLISNAHSEISRKRDHVFQQTKVGVKYNILATN